MGWEERWQASETPWDAGRAAPALEALVASGGAPDGLALVPGCGQGWDVLALASPSRQVLGLDLAPTAGVRFEALRAAQGVPEAQARVVCADFFAWSPPSLCAMVWDYTFLCALDPSLRPAWAARMRELLAPGGLLASLIFPVRGPLAEQDLTVGPPFSLHPDGVRALLAEGFEEVSVTPVAVSHRGREGMEWLGLWRRC